MSISEHFTKFGNFLKLIFKTSKKEENIFKKILTLRGKEDVEGIRRLEWKIFRWSMLVLIIILTTVFILGLMFFNWIGKIFLLMAFCGITYALYELLGKKVIRWVKPLEVGLLVDKFTGRTNEVGREGLIITLPTDEVSIQAITVRRHDVKVDYLTIDGSITLTATIFYTVFPAEVKDFLIVETELANALTARIQELIQAESGDRYTDEVISEQRALSEQLRIEMTGSQADIWLGRLGISRRKIADLEGSIKILDALIERLELAIKGKSGIEKEAIKRDRIDAEKERDRLIEARSRRLNIAIELVEELLISFQTALQSEVSGKEGKQITKGLEAIKSALSELPFAKATLSATWLIERKTALEALLSDCTTKCVNKNGDAKDTAKERTGLEKDFHINITGTRLYDPTLDEKAKAARDAKVTMKYNQEAVVTEYQTTKRVLKLLKEQLPEVSDKELIDYILAMRGKMSRNKDEKVFDIPGLSEVLQTAIASFAKK